MATTGVPYSRKPSSRPAWWPCGAIAECHPRADRKKAAMEAAFHRGFPGIRSGLAWPPASQRNPDRDTDGDPDADVVQRHTEAGAQGNADAEH
jgi:hypothetical protein